VTDLQVKWPNQQCQSTEGSVKERWDAVSDSPCWKQELAVQNFCTIHLFSAGRCWLGITTTATPRLFYGPFSGTTRWADVEKNFWTSWCKARLTEADTPTIWLGATPSGLSSAHLHHPPCFLQARCPSCRPANSIKALKATSAFRLGRRC